MNEYKKHKDLLEGLDKAESAEKDLRNRKADWSDKEDVNTYTRGKRLHKRLKRIPMNRICPSCRRLVVNPGSWCIRGIVQCRMCRHKPAMNIKDVQRVKSKVFSPIIRYEIYGGQLIRTRGLLGINRKKFSILAGWSVTYQQKIETELVTVNVDTFDTICIVIKESGGNPADIFVGIQTRFEIDGGKMKELRKALGESLASFSYKIKWMPSYQTFLENGRVRTVSERTVKRVMKLCAELVLS